MLKAAFNLCGSSFAIVCANKSPDPGVALNPPVPQPQLKYKPLIDVLLIIGLASGQISTIPPHCLKHSHSTKYWI